jgi:hypothetical protein
VRVRTATAARNRPWTVTELDASLPRLLVPAPTWKVTASHEAQPTPQANAEGGYNYTASAGGALTFLGWTTGAPQQPGMWLQVELPSPVMLTEIQFTSSTVGGGRGSAPVWTFPRAYQVQVSADGNAWSQPVAEGQGSPATTTISFPPVSARFVRMTQTATVTDGPPWSIRLLRLYEAPH